MNLVRLAGNETISEQVQNVHLEFRPMTEADFPQLLTWLNEPLVNEWYCSGQQRSMEFVHETYGPRVNGTAPTECFVAVVDGVDAGMVQCYWVASYPEYAASVGAEPGWMGVDYFIGEPTLRGRGLSGPLLRTFVDRRVFDQHGAKACVSGPEPANVRSIAALKRAGFQHLRTVGVDGELEYIMIRRRESVEGV